MPKQHVVRLAAHQRADLTARAARDSTPAELRRRFRVLLLADAAGPGPAPTGARVAERARCSVRTVARLRARFAAEGLGPLLRPRTRPDRAVPALDADAAERLTLLACSPPPDGYARWSAVMLADRLVALGEVDAISRETVRRTLKKTRSSPG